MEKAKKEEWQKPKYYTTERMGKRFSVALKSVASLMCVSPACLLKAPRPEFLGAIEILTVASALDTSKAAGRSHVATVFATATIIPLGNTRGLKVHF